MTEKLTKEERVVIDENARLLWEDTTKEANSHLYEAERWGSVHLQLGLFATALSAITGASIFSQNDVLAVVAGILSIALLVSTALTTFLHPEQQSANHFKAGISFQTVANRAERLYQVKVKLGIENPMGELKELTDERDQLLLNSPRVSQKYRDRADKAWKEKEMEWARREKEAIERGEQM